ncbi:hypothetical protein ARALYDRAFT_908035 [Arabidopsis lyrata subsp. lyrata]|uniref:Uncharacterized protein n=1 Tax=Arabidopsis lyrata subsp. lyrata TaxID=81972 RepID=D7M746_ARALL|nr:hypothetical protein ARALYDRAFT_908035 [Arabidopsis lyrata subsp. lyrata]
MNKPVAVHCIDAFDDLLEIMRSIGPFPGGVILHSFNGSAEGVPKLNELGAYLSFSGWFTYIDEKIGKKALKLVCDQRDKRTIVFCFCCYVLLLGQEKLIQYQNYVVFCCLLGRSCNYVSYSYCLV